MFVYFMVTSDPQILVFKTNIRSDDEKERLTSALAALEGIIKWTVDCEDVDCVLRVVTNEYCAEELIRAVQKAGFECTELPD